MTYKKKTTVSDDYLFLTLKQVLHLFSIHTEIAVHLNEPDFPIEYQGSVNDLLYNKSYEPYFLKFGEVYQIQIEDSICHIFLF